MKPSILLLHGALSTSKQLALLADKLGAHFDVFTLDFTGHSQSPYDGVLNMKVLVSDISQYFEKMGSERCHIFGYSMGGYAAVAFAKSEPKQLGKIVTLGTKWDWNPESSAREVAMLDPDVMVEKVPSYVAKLQVIFGDENWKSVVQQTADLMFDLGHGGALTADDFGQIETEILILRGSEDKMVSANAAKEVESLLRNGTYRELAGAPHPLEKVDIDVLVREMVN